MGEKLSEKVSDGPLEDWWEVEKSFPAVAADAILSLETSKNLYGLKMESFSYGIGSGTGEFIGCALLGGLPYEKVIELMKIKGEYQASAPSQRNWRQMTIKANFKAVQALIEEQDDIHICAISGPGLSAVSGLQEYIATLQKKLEHENKVATLLALSSGTNNPG